MSRSLEMNNEMVESAPTRMADEVPSSPAWMAVFSLAMGVFGLLTAEYLLPVCLHQWHLILVFQKH